MEASHPDKKLLPADGAQRSLGHDPLKPIMTLGDLLDSDIVGMWKDREDMGDTVEWARKLREKHQRRDLT